MSFSVLDFFTGKDFKGHTDDVSLLNGKDMAISFNKRLSMSFERLQMTRMK